MGQEHVVEVAVQKEYLTRGTIKIVAEGQNEADQIVQSMISSGELQTVDLRIEWGEPEYQDYTFIVI